MTNSGFDPVSEAHFRATIENEVKHVWKQVDLLWHHNRKRSDEIDAIKRLIYGALISFAAGAAGLAFLLLKPKLGL